MAETSLETIQALLEGMRRESKLAWDGLRRETAARFDALEQRLEAIDTKQGIANGRVNTMEKALELVHEWIKRLQSADGQHEARMTSLDQALQPVLRDAEFAHRRASDPPSVATLHGRDADAQRTLVERLMAQTWARYAATLVAGGAFLKFIEWFVKEVVR